MKVEAYICDYKNHLVEVDGIMGITPVEDLFDMQASFPICHQDKTRIHICGECYRKFVLIPASAIDRKKNEREYELKVKELAYALRSTAFKNALEKQRSPGKKARKKKD